MAQCDPFNTSESESEREWHFLYNEVCECQRRLSMLPLEEQGLRLIIEHDKNRMIELRPELAEAIR